MLHRFYRWAAALALLLVVGVLLVQAQETTPDPSQAQAEATETPQAAALSISSVQPGQMTTGVASSIAIFGANFTPQTQVSIPNIGALQTQYTDPSTVTAALPANLPPGQYTLQLQDPISGTAASPIPLVVVAQQATATHTATATTQPIEPLSVSRSEPGQVTTGQGATLSVLGAGFTNTTTVRLVGFGFLETTFVNSQALTAMVPPSLPPGQYGIEVSDAGRGTVGSPNTLTVVQPTTTPAALPTFEPPTAFPTQEAPTPVPGSPSLIVRNFASIPAVVQPGGVVEIRFEVVNQGNRPAQGVTVAIGADGSFVPASGQASATVTDIQPGGSATVSLNAVASMEAAAGPNNVPISMNYRDFSGETYTSSASVSVEVGERSEASQVVLMRYTTQPDPVEPGQRIMVDLLVMNTGTDIARQVLVRIAGENGVLLPGSQGDSFALGDLAPQESANLSVPMVVSQEAKAGPQAQPLSLSWQHSAETQEIAGSITVDVRRVIDPEPIILLRSYSTGEDLLQPGDRFTLSLDLQNVGSANANGVLITFGTVEAQSGGGSGSGSGGDSGSGSGSGSGTGGSTTTTGISGNAFATIGSGGTVFAGSLLADGSLSIDQDFVVNGTVDSGIYSIPITVRYTTDKGDAEQITLPASVIVLAPPRLQVSLGSPMPETVNVGEPFPVSLEAANTGADTINTTTASVTVENGEVLEGAESTIGGIPADDDTTLNALIMPTGEGPVRVTFTLHYRDDLNQMQALDYTYSTEAVEPPPLPEAEMPPEDMPPVVEAPPEDNMLGRVLLGFLGLGG